MQFDPKEKEKGETAPSDEVANAHASGDGALERSEPSREPTAGDDELHAEDQNHIPY